MKRHSLVFWTLAITSAAALAACGSHETSATSAAGSGGSSSGSQALPLDPTDYDSTRDPIRSFYDSDVPTYWATWGLPPLARRSHVIEDGGGDYRQPFAGLAQAFDANAFTNGVELATLPKSFVQQATTQLMTGAAPWDACIFALRAMVDASDQAVFTEGATAALVAQTAADLRAVFVAVFTAADIDALAPTGQKQFDAATPPNFPDEVCSATAYESPVAAADGGDAGDGGEGGTDDHNTASKVAWVDISNAHDWDVTYNAACIAVAVGACASEADPQIFDSPEADCELYNTLSKNLGAKPGQLGGYESNRDTWFKARGYCGARAWSGPFETACAEAFSAWQRGCDLFIDYKNPDPKKSGHTEHVEHVNWGGPGSGDSCDLDTRSWGQQSSVHYGGGNFSGKSDAQRYGGPGSSGAWLGETHSAHLTYYCKCQH
jgi:hypothetical protein